MNTESKRKPLVLVVEDERMLRMLARESLHRSGFEVIEACDGIEALEALSLNSPDLIVLDVKMPRMDGFSVCEKVRATEGGRHTPILVMTGLDDLESIERAYEVGATDFVNKPVNWLVLGHRVEYMLRASRSASELRENRERLAEAQQIARLGTWEWHPEQATLQLSTDLVGTLGLEPQQSWDETVLRELIHPSDLEQFEQLRTRLTSGSSSTQFDFRLITRQGEEKTFHQFRVNAPAPGAPVNGTVQDVTEERRQAERIVHLSYYDALTGLPNRRALLERLDYLTRTRERSTTAVMLLDVDRFQRLNEALGHGAGDSLLQSVAERLGRSLRKRFDPGGSADSASFLARIGGDEFAVVAGIEDAHQASTVADRLRSALQQPFVVERDEVSVSISLGIAMFPQDGGDPQTLLNAADSALFRAKQEGRNRFDFYDASLGRHTKEKLLLEKDLPLAMTDGELFFHYQPQYQMATGRIVGVEALMRWSHPRLGLVPPDKFIPIAEEAGHDIVLGEWTVRQIALQARRWAEAGSPIRIGLNLSGACLQDVSMVEWFEAALSTNEIPASLLEVEITERTLLEESQVVLDNLDALRALGVGLALDDFGTGYSALSYLSRFPFDSLKVDRSFVSDVEANEEKRNLVSAIVVMAKKLGFRPIAEGIETPAQWHILKEEGCDEAQGFLMSRPVVADAVLELLAGAPFEDSGMLARSS